MKRVHPLGIRRESIPIPPAPEATEYVQQGRLRIGVEYRVVDDHALDEHFASSDRQKAILKETREDFGLEHGDIAYEGVSVHVIDAETGHEHLRFDAFPEDPHYHYIVPGDHHQVIVFDNVAEPDFTHWVMDRLQARMADMLAYAGAEELASAVTADQIAAIMPRVRELVGESRQRPTAQNEEVNA